MIRLFISLQLPPEIRVAIKDMARPFPGAKPVAEEQLHLTLKFLGEVDSGLVLDIREKLHEIKMIPFQIKLKGVGVFPPRKNPRVLWVGIEPQNPVAKLRNSIENVLSTLSIPRNKKKFTPHITLARLKGPSIKHLQLFFTLNGLFESPEFTIDEYHLYASKLNPRGAIHTVIESYPLKGKKTLNSHCIKVGDIGAAD